MLVVCCKCSSERAARVYDFVLSSQPSGLPPAWIDSYSTVSESLLVVGTLIPGMPTVKANKGRIFPQTFRDGLLCNGRHGVLRCRGGSSHKSQ